MLRSCLLLLPSMLFGATFAIAQPPQGAPDNPRRQALERELMMRTGEIVRRRLELNDDQMRRLQATNRQFEEQRGALLRRDRETRQALRREILSGDSANQDRVAQLLDQTLIIERQRIELVQTEQRELAKFLTPVQRARLLAVQSELRMRTQELRQRQNRRGGPPPMRRNP